MSRKLIQLSPHNFIKDTSFFSFFIASHDSIYKICDWKNISLNFTDCFAKPSGFLLQSNISRPDSNDRAINDWEHLYTLIFILHHYEAFWVFEIHQLTQNHLGDLDNRTLLCSICQNCTVAPNWNYCYVHRKRKQKQVLLGEICDQVIKGPLPGSSEFLIDKINSH